MDRKSFVEMTDLALCLSSLTSTDMLTAYALILLIYVYGIHHKVRPFKWATKVNYNNK